MLGLIMLFFGIVLLSALVAGTFGLGALLFLIICGVCFVVSCVVWGVNWREII